MKKRFLSLLCVLALCLGLLPATALAAAPIGQVLYVGGVQISSTGYWTTDSDGNVTASTAGDTPTDNYIHYDAENNVLTLHNATIKKGLDYNESIQGGTYINGSAIGVFNQNGDAELTITLEGTNTIAEVGKGIFVLASSASTGSSNLTIQGDGSLNASASQTGIWVQSNSNNAALCVENAEVTASSDVAFKNGVLVQAKDGSDVSLTVNGGSLTASVNANIWFQFGSGVSGSGTPTVTVSNNAIVRANGGIANNSSTSIQYRTGNEENGGIVFDGSAGTVYGSVTLQDDLEIKSGETLTIGDGASLTVPDGKTLTNNGTVTVEEGGTLTNNGSLDCNHHTGGTATCTEKAKCDLCGAEYGDFLPHSLTKTEAKAPTCTVVGNEAYWTCGNCGKYFSDGNGNTEIIKDSWIISSINHDWNDAVYTWSDDGSTCTATRTCKNDSAHTEKATATVTGAQTKAPTCTQMGETTYTAAFEASWAMTQTKVLADIPAIGHSYGEPVWRWSEDGKTCKVTFTCEKDETHKETPVVKVTSAVKKPATCTETGVTTYTATVEFNGQTHKDTKDVADIPATGHSYGESVWNWAEDGKTCTVTFICEKDETHKETPKVKITSAVKTPATCTEAGVTTYTATVEFNGQTYTDTKDLADIPATGHSYGKPVWNWSEDGKTCTVTFTCEKDENHKESPKVDVTSAVKKPATCTETGVTTYTATVEFNGQTYTDTKDVADIPATGHSYDNGKCTVCGAIASDFKVIITAGANGSWQKGTKDGLTFTSNAANKYFQKVQVDGKDLDASNYTVKEGSTIVTLKTSYLETLSVGKHTLAIVSETGTATTEFTIKAAAVTDDTQSPQTGDDSNIALWIAVLLAAGTALTGTAVYSRKRKYSK